MGEQARLPSGTQTAQVVPNRSPALENLAEPQPPRAGRNRPQTTESDLGEPFSRVGEGRCDGRTGTWLYFGREF